MSTEKAARDPLAIAIAIVGFVTQIGVGIYWGGLLEGRVASLEMRMDKTEQTAAYAAQRDGEHDVKIAVSVQQQADIISRLQRIESKLEQPR
jgi:hypothetical protein